MSEKLRGTAGDDRLSTDDPNVNMVIGQRGNDVLDLSTRGGGAYGGMGDDTLIGGGVGARQSHIYGGPGTDHIYFNTGNNEAPFGDHAWGGGGHDKFHFTTDPSQTERVTGRIDDFDPSRDSIWVNDQKINFNNLPENIRIVQLHSQPWILIDERILYALEGARQFEGAYDADYDGDGESIEFGNGETEEAHFLAWPEDWKNGVPEDETRIYHDFNSFFPAKEYTGAVDDWELPTFDFTEGGDKIVGTIANERLIGGDGADYLSGKGGDDLIHAGEYDDTVYGGQGTDSISGGLDNDLIYGDSGADHIYGGSGQDTIYGGLSDDEIYGNNGLDKIFGEAGNDTLSGGWNDDTVYGGAGDDLIYAAYTKLYEEVEFRQFAELYGGEGEDTLHGEVEGDSTMEGGEGDDMIVMHEGAHITITDFIPGEDEVDLNGLMPPSDKIDKMLQEQMREDGGSNMVLSLGTYGALIFENLGEVDRMALLASISQEQPVDESLYTDPTGGTDDPDDPDDDDDDGGEDDGDDDDDNEGEEDDSSDGSCFVATACFGGAAHPDVAWLRQFRNRVLRRSLAGRIFIATYWRVGPILARGVRHKGVSGRVLRKVLGRLVRWGQAVWPEITVPRR